MRKKITIQQLLLVLALAGGCALTCACGQTGPLYLPDDTGQSGRNED